MLDKLREKMPVFDLCAFLIKPVQRVLKYPLLLNELIKVSGTHLKLIENIYLLKYYNNSMRICPSVKLR